MADARDRLIVALDVPSAAEAHRIVASIGESASIYKVGKQLFTAEGPQVVRDLVASGREVFLDLKYHDIPSTVAAAVRAASALGVSMLTVHASGGLRMLKAAVEAARDAWTAPRSSVARPNVARPPSAADSQLATRNSQLLVLAVTVLTSLNDEDLQEIGVSGRVLDHCLRLAALARTAGCDGIICSAREVRELRRELGSGFAIVTPGIRPAGSARADQERVMTPAEAIAAGASHIVVGRPITASPDPAAAARRILEEIASACETVTT
jgi:orotidine-5'-phosphate decarboxylase